MSGIISPRSCCINLETSSRKRRQPKNAAENTFHFENTQKKRKLAVAQPLSLFAFSRSYQDRLQNIHMCTKQPPTPRRCGSLIPGGGILVEQEDQGRMRDGAPIEFSPAGFSRFLPRGRFAKSGFLRVCVSVCACVKVCAYASIFIAASSRNTWQLFFVFARAPTDYCARSQSMIEHFIRELRHGSCSPLLRHVGGGGRAGG